MHIWGTMQLKTTAQLNTEQRTTAIEENECLTQMDIFEGPCAVNTGRCENAQNTIARKQRIRTAMKETQQ